MALDACAAGKIPIWLDTGDTETALVKAFYRYEHIQGGIQDLGINICHSFDEIIQVINESAKSGDIYKQRFEKTYGSVGGSVKRLTDALEELFYESGQS